MLDKRLMMNFINEGDERDIVPNNSTTNYLIVLQGIALEIGRRMGVSLDDFKINLPGSGIGARLSGRGCGEQKNGAPRIFNAGPHLVSICYPDYLVL